MRSPYDAPHGNIYTAAFSAQESSGVAERDIFELKGTTDTRFKLLGFTLAQHTEVAGASESRVSLEVLTGATAAAAGGSTLASLAYNEQARQSTAKVVCVHNSTTVASTVSETLRWAGAWPQHENFEYKPPRHMQIESRLDGQLNVRMSIGSTMLISGTITWQETGKVPGESL